MPAPECPGSPPFSSQLSVTDQPIISRGAIHCTFYGTLYDTLYGKAHGTSVPWFRRAARLGSSAPAAPG